MDGFTAGVLAFAVWTGLVFNAGIWWAEPDVAKACNDKGEYTIRSVVYECKPVAGIINGKRVELKP